jgi:hypothetical protein
MSLSSLQNKMDSRTASMAEMAKHLSNPQDIQTMQQRLVSGIQNGSIKPYIGIPLIQELTQKLTEAKAQAAQTVMGGGMPQGQGAAPSAPIAQQVMQQAEQGQGVEALPSNLPQSYAGGGIIAFKGGGEASDWEKPTLSYEEQMRRLFGAIGNIPKHLVSAPGYGFNTPATPPPAQPLAGTTPSAPYDPSTATRRSEYETAPVVPSTPGGPSSTPGGINSKMLVLGSMNPPAAPPLTDINAITKDLSKELQNVSEKAVKATQEQLEGFDKPLEEKATRMEEREGKLAKDTEISRWLSVLKGGLATLGGTSRNAAENIGKGLSVGVDDAIRGEAANRVAKDRLEDAKDRLDDQRIAAKKGNFQAAQTAGQRAADDLRASTQMTMTGAHYGNTESLQRYQTQQQGEQARATLDQSGKLGIAGLGLQAQQLAQTGAYQQGMLGMQEKRYAAMDKASQARLDQVRAGAVAKFNELVGPQINAGLDKEYGKNWRTGQDPRSLEARMKLKQAQNAYISDALGQHEANTSARDISDV